MRKKPSAGKPSQGQRQIHPPALAVDFGVDGAWRHPAAREPGYCHAQIRTKPRQDAVSRGEDERLPERGHQPEPPAPLYSVIVAVQRDRIRRNKRAVPDRDRRRRIHMPELPETAYLVRMDFLEDDHMHA